MQESARTLTMTKDHLESLVYRLDEMNFRNVWSLNLKASSDIEMISIQDNDQERWASEIQEVLKSDLCAKRDGSIVFWSDFVKLIINPPGFFEKIVQFLRKIGNFLRTAFMHSEPFFFNLTFFQSE